MPDMRDECLDLWDTFTRLSSCSYTEIQAYSSITGEQLSRWEVDALVGLARIRSNPPQRLK